MKKFRAVCLAFVMMLSVAVMLCGCGDTKITDKVNFSDVDEITVVMSDESTAVLGEVDFKTVKNILQSAETGGTSGEFDGGILIETRKDGIVTHNISVGGADKICVDKDNSTVYKISDGDYKTLEKVMDNYKLKRLNKITINKNISEMNSIEKLISLFA